jgi:hypothetical protein
MTDPGIFAGTDQVLPEVTGQSPDEREVQVPLAAAVGRGGDVHRPHDEAAHDSGPDHRVTANAHSRRRVDPAEGPGRHRRPESGRRRRRITGRHRINVHDRSPPARPRHLSASATLPR